MSSLFGGGGSQTQTGGSSSTASINYAPWYESYAKDLLARGQELAKTPFQPYDVSKMFAPFQPDQLQAFQQVRQNQGAYAPYIGAATGALGAVSGLDPYGTGMPFIQAAAQTPTGFQAGAPYMQRAAQTWNPRTQAQYTNPFLQGSVNYANQLATQNFLEQTLPGINAQFVKSGGGLGGKRYQDFMNRAVRDFSNTMFGQAQTAAANNYWQGAGQFNQDLNRQLQVGQGLGGLATGTQGALGQLGQTASGITSGAINTGAGLANAYSNLGGALSNLNLTNTNALLQAGNQQQQFAQNPLTAAYQQYQQGVQFPYNQLSWLGQLSSGLRIPSTQQTTSQNWQTTSANNSPSILGGILGGASMLGGIMGGPLGSALGGMAGSLFGGGGGGMMASATPNMGGISGASWNPGAGYSFPGGSAGFGASPIPVKRGGAIRKYSQGGTVPVVRGINNRSAPALAMAAQNQRPPVPMPRPSSGALARAAAPMMGGALSAAR